MVAIAFALAQIVKTYIVQPFVIPSGSMIPTIQLDNRVLAEKISYRFSDGPEYGDIAVFRNPLDSPPILIKRVIATQGQVVDLRDGVVYIDDKPLDEPYTHGLPSFPESPLITYPFTVPEGHVWMMGDNRTNSGDSREFGPVQVDAVMGRAFWTYWPPTQFGSLD
jgi:signal peptidase I